MPQPDKLLATIRKAAEYVRTEPGRLGRVVTIVDGLDVLVAGDLHGNVGNFQLLLKRAELAKHPHRHFVMQELIHGAFRYADGSDKSHQAVDLWCALKCQYPTRVHYLPGNHELSQWTNRAIGKTDMDLNASFLDGVRNAYGRDADSIYAAYLDLFASLPVAIRTPNRVFLSHSLPNAAAMTSFDVEALRQWKHAPEDLAPGGLVYGMVWGRDTSAANVAAFMKKVDADWLVTGHVPCAEGFGTPNEQQVIVDCLGSPAAYMLLPANVSLTTSGLRSCVQMI
jgi:hypothetical protein